MVRPWALKAERSQRLKSNDLLEKSPLGLPKAVIPLRLGTFLHHVDGS